MKQLVKILLLIPLSFGLYAGEIETLLEETKETPKTADPAYLESLETLFQVVEEHGNSPEYFMEATLRLMDFNEEFQIDSLYFKEKIDEAQKLLPQVNSPSLKGRFYLRKAYKLHLNSNFAGAESLAGKAIDFFETEGDSLLNDYGQAYALLASINNSQGDFIKALNYSNQAIRLFEIQRDTLSLLWSSMNLEIMFSNNLLEAESEQLRDQNRELARRVEAHEILANSLITEYITLRKKGEVPKAIEKLEEALGITAKITGFQGEIMHFMISCLLVINESNLNEVNKADEYMSLVKDEYGRFNDLARMRAFYDMALAHYYYVHQNYTACEKLNLKNIKGFEESYETEGYLLALELMVKLYHKTSNLASEYEYYSHLTDLKESIFDEAKTNQLLFYRESFKAMEREQELASEKRKVADILNAHQNKIRLLMLGAIILALLAGVFYLNKNRKIAEEREEAQRYYSQQLLMTQEKERKRISKDLHDGMGQSLILLQNKATEPEAKELIKETLGNMRNMTQDLHPFVLERFGFTEGVRQMADRIDQNTSFFVVQEIAEIETEIPEEKALNLYRMMQEALNNCIKYSESETLKISVQKEDNFLKCTVQDFGKGFDVQKARRKKQNLGLKTLEERAVAIGAVFDLYSEPGKGTKYSFGILV